MPNVRSSLWKRGHEISQKVRNHTIRNQQAILSQPQTLAGILQQPVLNMLPNLLLGQIL
jgi:hypothetical protein